jgi:hypothetical protein
MPVRQRMRGWAGPAGRADGPGSSWRLERWGSPVVATVLVLAVLVLLAGAAFLIRERPLDRLHQHAVVEFGVEGDLDANLIPNGHGVKSVSRSMTLRAKKR